MLGTEYGHPVAVALEQERRDLEDKLCTVHYRHTFYGYQITKISGILCDDGKRRTAIVRGEPDTWFTQPAYVRVRGRTVSGFITTRYDEALGGDRRIFLAYKYGRNGWLLDYSVADYEKMQRAREELIIDNHISENCPKCGAILYFHGGFARCCNYDWPCQRLRDKYGPYGPNADVRTLEDIYEWVKQREVEVLEEDAACLSDNQEQNAKATNAHGSKLGRVTGTMRRILSRLRSAVTNTSHAATSA